MAIGGARLDLDESRDLLVNVNAQGAPVPSARFMGGREYELALQGAGGTATEDAMRQILADRVMLLPGLVPESGPFRGHQSEWSGAEPPVGSDLRAAAVAFYLALVSAECLRLIGQAGPVIVEGPFSKNTAYLRMLQAATGKQVLRAKGLTGTSQGAALLCGGKPARDVETLAPLEDETRSRLEAYASGWSRTLCKPDR